VFEPSSNETRRAQRITRSRKVDSAVQACENAHNARRAANSRADQTSRVIHRRTTPPRTIRFNITIKIILTDRALGVQLVGADSAIQAVSAFHLPRGTSRLSVLGSR